MHMSDALITPLVGGTMLASSIGIMNYSVKKVEMTLVDQKLPYMSVVSAFVFAAQMINFAIPGTGSSGHIGGGMLLAILLGPQAGFISMATILLLQALFFADGGLLAFGCNLINLGFFTCFLAYPLIYKPLSKGSKGKLLVGTVLATVIALQFGSFGVVLQTVISGRSDLPFKEFLMFMQPIHLAIGLVEGLITASIVSFLFEHREALVFDFFNEHSLIENQLLTTKTYGKRRIIQFGLVITLVVAGIVSQFASSNPDGLEWSIENAVSQVSASDNERVKLTSTIEMTMHQLQSKTALLPDYALKESSGEIEQQVGTSLSGIVGSLLILSIISAIGVSIRWIRKLQ